MLAQSVSKDSCLDLSLVRLKLGVSFGSVEAWSRVHADAVATTDTRMLS